MVELWWSEARRHQVLPLDDRFRERVADSSRPPASERRDVYRYFPGTAPIPNQALPITLNCRHAFTAWLTLDGADDHGFLVGQGSELSGWALFVKDGRGVYVSNCVQVAVCELRTASPLPIGREFSLRVEYEPLDIGLGTVRLRVDGEIVGTSERVRTAPLGYSNALEGLQIGRSWATPIAFEHYRGSYPFTARLRLLELQTDPTTQLCRSSFADPGETR